MKELRGEEKWCQSILSTVLGVRVEQHDDGSRPGMHDLDVLFPDGRRGAVEVTAAADADAIEFWNLINGSGERWIEPQLKGGWTVSAWPTARAKRLRKELPTLLRMLEDRAIVELSPDDGGVGRGLGPFARDLGIVHAHQGGTAFPGSIYILPELTFEQSGGMVGDSGDPLADWIGGYLAAPDQNDVRGKLARSGVEERHAFIILPSFTPASFTVAYLLMEDGAPLPVKKPMLPQEVTHVWAMSTWSTGRVVSWSPAAGWASSPKLKMVQ